MANNSILKLQVDDKQYEASLKSAQQGLQALMNALRNSGKSFSDLDKNTEQYVRALGNMEATAKTTRGRIGEMSSAFVELSQVEKLLTDQERQSPVGKALTESLNQLKQRTIEAKQELADLDKQLTSQKAPATTDGGGLFGGGKLDGMLQVFGGNVMTKVAGMATGLVTEMGDAVKQGIELARQGEGIRIAFERLGRGDILQGLREATHGTVTDLELMKAAVKFNDFKLPVEELGTMLAFAQQKAKDTGQSVDYMVDSIVTGLGRKSLMILDNLGLSAAEIKERMKETGDMTKAVGAIIRDQMAKAGDYVETAADRAAQANVSLQNKMEELGRKFGPLEQASTQFWTSMKIGILDIVGGPLAELLNGLTEAGRLQNMLNNLNGEGDNTKVGGQLKKLQAIKKAGGSSYMFNSTLSGMMEDYNRQIMELDTKIKDTKKLPPDQQASKFVRDEVQKMSEQMKALGIMRDELKKGAQGILNPNTQNTTTTTTTDPKKGAKEKELTELQQNQQKINDLTQEYVKLGDESTEVARERQAEIQKEIALLEKRNSLLGLRAEQAQGRFLVGAGDFQKEGLKNVSGFGLLDVANSFGKSLDIPKDGFQLSDKLMGIVEKNIENSLPKIDKKEKKGPMDDTKKVVNGLSQVASGLQQMGIELPEGVNQVLGVVNGLMTIIGGITSIISATEVPAQIANTAALWALTEAMWANTFLGFSGGGIVGFAKGGLIGKAASGMLIGNHMSGDNLRLPVNGGGYIGVNDGELILNRAQQGVLADALQGGGAGSLGLSVKVTAEELRFILGNNSRRRGKGEYVTTNRLR